MSWFSFQLPCTSNPRTQKQYGGINGGSALLESNIQTVEQAERSVSVAVSGFCFWGILRTPLGTLNCLWWPGKGHHRRLLLWARSSTHFWQFLSAIPYKVCLRFSLQPAPTKGGKFWLLAGAREGLTHWQGLGAQLELYLCHWAWRRGWCPLDTTGRC